MKNKDLNGVVNVYKEAGMTSFQVVAAVRRITGIKKCGHTGTLDPMAEGVLPVCVGFATRFADRITAYDKQYIAEFILGKSYDSYDTTGTVTAESGVVPDKKDVEKAFGELVGNKELTVPAFSAKKINGERAYDLARKGELADAGKSVMRIDNITVQSYCYPNGTFTVDCGKGTYVRSIINEAGLALKSYAAMSGLIRSKNGGFILGDAVKISKLEEMAKQNDFSFVESVEKYLDLPDVIVKGDDADKITNGRAPAVKNCLLPDNITDGECLLKDDNNNLLALGEYKKVDFTVKLLKVFAK